MKLKSFHIILLTLNIFLIACDSSDSKDTEKPIIDISRENTFPLNCSELYFGEEIEINYLFKDNFSLGSYSIDIHNNFDHHSHSTEVISCDFEDIKKANNPFKFTQEYTIPENQNSYDTKLKLVLPTEDENGKFDEGDYHFFISLTDHEGWSTQKGFNIKIRHK
ncbi:MAG: DUF4625 domain-containing protein [Marinifilaceae bacterium]|jgi:hypothetical protein|nr:DUF4625 domain-containing protein [Marinifilaceae bacterium]